MTSPANQKLQWMQSQVDPSAFAGSILEIGSRHAVHTQWFLTQAQRVVVIEPTMHRELSKLSSDRLQVIQGRIERTCLRGRFDTVVALGVFSHLANPFAALDSMLEFQPQWLIVDWPSVPGLRLQPAVSPDDLDPLRLLVPDQELVFWLAQRGYSRSRLHSQRAWALDPKQQGLHVASVFQPKDLDSAELSVYNINYDHTNQH